ncbi:MAG: hypothetical protein L0Y36_00545 [Planctomycetales bacterium]|nr:hypothetical protein [Planctomycetales bacterium]
MAITRNPQKGLGIALICIIAASLLWAAEDGARRGQDQRGPGRQGESGQRGGFNFDPGAMQQRMMEAMKTRLGITKDAEWVIIEPRLSKVMTLSRSASNMGGMMRGMMGRGGMDRSGRRPDIAGRQDTQAPEDPVQKASDSLQEALDKPDVSPDEIKTKLQAFREAREKAQQELAKARQELQEVLTLRQEAQLVLMGMLD